MNPSQKQAPPAVHKQAPPEILIDRHLKILTLGQGEVLVHGQPAKWHSDSARALFFYLLSHPDGKSREEIIDAIWNSSPSAAINNRFRVTMCRLRNALGWRESIAESHSRYQLDPAVLEASDSHEFYVLIDQAQHERNWALRLEGYEQAFVLYVGDYLPFETSTWVLKIRNEHNAAFARAKIAVSLLHCNQGLCQSSVGVLVSALDHDPFLGENHHQKLMSCLSVVEGKFAAIEHYRRFLAFLNSDIKDTPMPETVVLAARIKGGERICLRALHQANLPIKLQNPFVPDFHIQPLPMLEQRVLS
jgi:two-component SAPR family response regulator